MMRFLILLPLLFVLGCAANPRVYKCWDCGKVEGVAGGLLPGQKSECSRCGGKLNLVRHMTQEEWRESERRGYVTEKPMR
jgi:predicted nucleic acid-binding Zn ribbon protein